MAENKKSFVAYADWMETFEYLTDEEAGKLIKHLLRYVNDLNPVTDNRIVEMSFIQIKLQLKRDLDKWEETKGKRSKAGKESARLRALRKEQQTSTNPTRVESVQQNSTNPTVTVNDTVNVSVTDNVNDISINSNKPKNQKNDFKALVLNFNDDIKNCYQNCKNEFPEHLQPKTNKILFNWLSVIDKLNRIDKLPFSEIERIVKGIRNDSFWSKQFLSLTKLRKNDKNNVKYIVVFNEYLKYNKKEKKITGAESFKNAILKQLQDEQYTDI